MYVDNKENGKVDKENQMLSSELLELFKKSSIPSLTHKTIKRLVDTLADTEAELIHTKGILKLTIELLKKVYADKDFFMNNYPVAYRIEFLLQQLGEI
jgi:hypothetical protein